uniref:Uncharacterized protein n=1 Tax=Avena sativa TaxID=4498 RepID=A0ACD5XS27_AVESA
MAEGLVSSLRTQADVDALCQKHVVPSVYIARPAGDMLASSEPPPGSLCVYAHALEAGMRVPLHPFFSEALGHFGLAPAQLSPDGWRVLVGFVVLCDFAGVAPPSLPVFRSFFSLREAVLANNPRHLCPGLVTCWVFDRRSGRSGRRPSLADEQRLTFEGVWVVRGVRIVSAIVRQGMRVVSAACVGAALPSASAVRPSSTARAGTVSAPGTPRSERRCRVASRIGSAGSSSCRRRSRGLAPWSGDSRRRALSWSRCSPARRRNGRRNCCGLKTYLCSVNPAAGALVAAASPPPPRVVKTEQHSDARCRSSSPLLSGRKRNFEEANGKESVAPSVPKTPPPSIPGCSVIGGAFPPPTGFSMQNRDGYPRQSLPDRHDGDSADWEAARNVLECVVTPSRERAFAAAKPVDVIASGYVAMLQATNHVSFSLGYALELEGKLVERDAEIAALREQLENATAELAATKAKLESPKVEEGQQEHGYRSMLPRDTMPCMRLVPPAYGGLSEMSSFSSFLRRRIVFFG